MILTAGQIDEIKRWGRFNIPAAKMAIMLKLSRIDREMFIYEFDDPNSEIRLAWEEGRTLGEIEVMESLETFANAKEEGSGEAAKALGIIKKRQTINQLKRDLFGV
ncbi:MAG: hypothetical protein AB2L24_21830 [Mangrovibacterium sp.]